MRDYIDLVLCVIDSGERELFCAPQFSHLEEGQMVVVDTDDGEMTATVIKSVSLGKYDNEELDFILKLAGKEVKTLHRVISKIRFDKLLFEEEEA